MNFAEIILPLNLKGTFTYKVPAELSQEIKPGMRVLVPFRGKKIFTGIVFQLHDVEPEVFLAKELISLLDAEPVLPASQLSFWNWLSQYYLCNLGEIYRMAFPASLKLESETYVKLRPEAVVDYQNLDANELYLIQALEVRQVINIADIESFIPKKEIVRTINSLINLRTIEIDEKVNERYKTKESSFLRMTPEALLLPASALMSLLGRAPKQLELFSELLTWQEENPGKKIKKTDWLNQGYTGLQIKNLVLKNLIEEYQSEVSRLESYEGELDNRPQLSEAQKAALKAINEAFSDKKNVLLHGITSSGKTHLYLEKIQDTLDKGQNVLYLLPEIALTKQTVQRLERQFGTMMGFYHQKLTDFEKVEVWQKMKNKELRLVLGTRNALFLPFDNLGLIIVDEEHDAAFRPREVSPYFNAKDAALMLANFYEASVLLGSATPSVESYHASQTGKLAYVSMQERFGAVAPPKYGIVDFKLAQDQKLVSGNFSLVLINQIKKNLENGHQTMILHNRRGYANVVECESCGHVTYCSNCDVVMTYHKASNDLKCHYCGQKAAKPEVCPKCHSTNLSTKGVGVEQISEEISKIFPEAEVDRMDVDSMRKKYAYEQLYDKIESGETDILVGTQMISKGLDFDGIEVVAIPRADQLIYVQDFRAEERAYQLITQVAGRAGRTSGKGQVFIQTYNPQHSVFSLIKKNDTAEIYAYLLGERKKFHYPPYTKLLMVELKHRRQEKVHRASQFLGSVLRKYLPEECIFGPEPSPVSKVNMLYQYQILLKFPKGKNYELFKQRLAQSLEELNEITAYQSIKIHIMVDF